MGIAVTSGSCGHGVVVQVLLARSGGFELIIMYTFEHVRARQLGGGGRYMLIIALATSDTVLMLCSHHQVDRHHAHTHASTVGQVDAGSFCSASCDG